MGVRMRFWIVAMGLVSLTLGACGAIPARALHSGLGTGASLSTGAGTALTAATANGCTSLVALEEIYAVSYDATLVGSGGPVIPNAAAVLDAGVTPCGNLSALSSSNAALYGQLVSSAQAISEDQTTGVRLVTDIPGYAWYCAGSSGKPYLWSSTWGPVSAGAQSCSP